MKRWSDRWHVVTTFPDYKRETGLTALLLKLNNGKLPRKPPAETWYVLEVLRAVKAGFPNATKVEAWFDGQPLLAA